MNKKNLLFFAAAFIISILLLFLRLGFLNFMGSNGFSVSSIVGYMILGIGTAWCIIKNRATIKAWQVALSILLGASLLDVVFGLINYHTVFTALPVLIIWWLGILAGYIYTLLRSRTARIILVIIALLVGYWCSMPGYRMLAYNSSDSSFNEKTKESILTRPMFKDRNDQDVKLGDFQGKYLILHFWNTYCKDCFNDFTELQKLYDQVKGNDNIALYSVHCMDRNETYKTGYSILENKGLSFPCLNVPRDGYTCGWLNIKVYPTVLIIDKESNIIYRGDLDSAIKKISKMDLN